MRHFSRHYRPLRLLPTTLLVGIVVLCTPATPLWSYTPESPEVKRMVDRALDYLSTTTIRARLGGTQRGIQILVGYAAHKGGRSTSDPLVAQALKDSLAAVSEGADQKFSHYELSVAALLLADVDAVRYRPQLVTVKDLYVGSQLSDGGWGYPGTPQGDTSQTQYAVLALWTMQQANIPVPQEVLEKACAWLLRTQDVSGGFGYHPRDPGPGGPPLKQEEVRWSLTVAAAGTVLILGDTFGFYRSSAAESEQLGLPRALRRIKNEEVQRKVSIKPEQIENSYQRAVNWERANPYQRTASDWHYYMLYAFERMMSFKELSEGHQPKEPEWYNNQVKALMAAQAPDGAWGKGPDTSHAVDPICTAFGVLFLVRSTKKAIGSINEGLLAGGSGLPSDLSDAKIVDGKVKGSVVQNHLNDMLDLLASDEGSDLDPDELPAKLELATDPEAREKQLNRLVRMSRGGSWQARRVAVATLGQSGELKVAPALIYALSDEDTVVRRTARDGLRFISRRFDGFGLPDDPNHSQVLQAIRDWRAWYLKMDPSYVFLDKSAF